MVISGKTGSGRQLHAGGVGWGTRSNHTQLTSPCEGRAACRLVAPNQNTSTLDRRNLSFIPQLWVNSLALAFAYVIWG